jgi:hypothetical protein
MSANECRQFVRPQIGIIYKIRNTLAVQNWVTPLDRQLPFKFFDLVFGLRTGLLRCSLLRCSLGFRGVGAHGFVPVVGLDNHKQTPNRFWSNPQLKRV